MRYFVKLFPAVGILSMILAACSRATPTAAPTEPPAATEAAIVSVDLAGPPMQVGSFYPYADGSILAAVPGGPFVMGYNFFDNLEKDVTVGDFWIYTNEVTNAQYELCAALGKCSPPNETDNPGYGNYRFTSFPVVGVTYQQAVDYCAFVNGRLPTEAEWEKSARGPKGNLFPWGDNLPECSLLNFNNCEGNVIDVKSYPEGVSYYGLFDMAGNVREWAADWYEVEYNADGAIADPLGPLLGQKRSVRSSNFADSTDFAIAAHRFSLKPEDHLPDLGFRCVVEDPTYYAPYCQTNLLYGSDGQGNPTDDVVQVSDNCIQPGFDYDPDCEIQVTRIEVLPPSLPADYQIVVEPPDACSSSGPQKYKCDGAGETSGSITVIPGACEVTEEPGEGQCVPPYVEAPDPENSDQTICVGQGPGGNCMAGFTYNASLSCCSAGSSAQTSSYDCPPGFDKVGDDCVNNQSSDPPHEVSQDFGPITYCAPPDDPGGSCSITCGPGDKLCSDTCTCVYMYSACP